LNFLLDTNICIYALKNRPEKVLAKLKEVGPSNVAISVITLLELRHGAEKSQSSKKTHKILDLFLSPITVLPFDEDAANHGAQIKAQLQKQGTPIGDLDLLIAACARSKQYTLVSNNLKEFNRVEKLKTANWV